MLNREQATARGIGITVMLAVALAVPGVLAQSKLGVTNEGANAPKAPPVEVPRDVAQQEEPPQQVEAPPVGLPQNNARGAVLEKQSTAPLAELPPRDAQACRRSDGAPEMVVISGGRFLMGAGEKDVEAREDERPRHRVSVQPFAVGRCEVTLGEFRRFVSATAYRTDAEHPQSEGCYIFDVAKQEFGVRKAASWRKPGFDQDDGHPVVCVSHADAVAYARWLSEQTGAPYRLPTEAEWEYATRAGRVTSRYWGDDPAASCSYANVADQSAGARFSSWTIHDCNDGEVFTAPVASYGPNAFGLYDTMGNVWEWIQDCWHGDYEGAPGDGSTWQTADKGDCAYRVIRGGSWDFVPGSVRSADRAWNGTDEANVEVGFRLARDL